MRCSVFFVAIVSLSAGGAIYAQDNLVLRDYLSRAAKNSLAKYNSEKTAWYSEKSALKKEWAEVKVGGRVVGKTIVAEWTEESKSWLWLNDPDNNIDIKITKLKLNGEFLEFSLTGSGKAKGKAWGKIPKVVTADVESSANVEVTVEGKTKVRDGKFTEVEVSVVTGKLSDLRFNNDALKSVQGLVKDCANEYVKFKNDDIKNEVRKMLENFRP